MTPAGVIVVGSGPSGLATAAELDDLVEFRVLSVDGAPSPPELAGRKDTVYLEPRRHYRMLLTFEDFTDPNVSPLTATDREDDMTTELFSPAGLLQPAPYHHVAVTTGSRQV